ncbi:MAG: hypothetical protein JSU74_06265 [Candidatus Zixiibacteriota bacterium]|nr:MAG: hypothetical protein JSU74_06265 [candidate division Zixibacteria bacterium]
MMNCRGILPILLTLAILFPGVVYSQVNAFAETYDPAELLTALGVSESGPDENFFGLVVTVQQPDAGVVSEYLVDFSIEQYTYDLIKNGGLKIAFPTGFDLGPIETITISDDFPPLDLEVERFEVSDQLLTIYLQQVHRDDDLLFEDPVYLNVSLSISSVGNPTVVGAYQVAAVAFKQNNAVVAGPIFSSPFTIESNGLASIVVYPEGELTLRAGDDYTFGAEGFDQYGNKIEGLAFTWSLDCDNCIGTLIGSTLLATTPGVAHVRASVGAVTGTSGLITVLAGDLDRMELDIDPTQFVGYPLLGSGSIALYDAFDNPVVDYSLSQEPVALVVSSGVLSPDLLADDALLSANIVDLLLAEIAYDGLSGAVNVRAENARALSNTVSVSFNGYDVLDALDNTGETISSVYADGWSITNLADVVIHREGNVAPTGTVWVRTRFLSHPLTIGRGVNADQLNYGLDTVTMGLPGVEHPSNEDTILVTVEAKFEFDGATYTTVDSSLFPVAVASLDAFSFVPDSFKPDSVVEEVPFTISFDIFSEGFALPIDSASVTVRLLDAPPPYGATLATIYNGPATPYVFQMGTVRFEDLAAVLPQSIVEANDYYSVDVTPTMFSGATVLTVEEFLVDSIYVLQRPELSVDPATLIPTTVSAGAVAQFQFIFELVSDYPLEFVAESSSFTLSNSIFNAVTELVLDGESIIPGENEFTSDGIFIPESMLDHELNVLASIVLRIPGTPYTFRFETDFNGLSVPVTALPVIQILEVNAIAPNTPNVNTDQTFQISAIVANVSPNPISSLGLVLSSDGGSHYDSDPLLVSLQAHDTSEFFWEITAASAPNPAEIFAVDIEQSDVIQLPALDHVALVTIETPARLELTHSLFGVENGFIDYGSDFNLTVELVNIGMAAVTASEYMLTIDGLDGDGPDTLSGGISEGIHIDFSFVAPQHDTTVNLTFALLATPIDMNIGEAALIGDTSFELSMRVISAEALLFVDAATIGTNLVLPGRIQSLFQLTLTNTGISSATCLQLDRLGLVVKDSRGAPIEAMSVFNIGTTGFWENDSKVSTLTAGDSLLLFSFDQFVLEPQMSRALVFQAEFEPTDLSAVVLDMGTEGLAAHFMEGPNAGLSPIVVSDAEEGEPLITQALAIKQSGLGGSFMIETNPFNPEDPSVTPVRLSYELDGNAAVEFRIFSVTGEEVYARDYSSGEVGGSSGENVIEWDGCNDNGHVVLNGVYIALVKNTETGESARIKIAVVK